MACFASPAECAPADLRQSKALIDRMTADLTIMVGQVEKARSDEEVKQIGARFKVRADRMKAEGDALSARLTDEEKVAVEAYSRTRMSPLMDKVRAAMKKTLPATESRPAVAVNCGTPEWKPYLQAITAYCTGKAKARSGCDSLVQVMRVCKHEYSEDAVEPIPARGIAAGKFTYKVSVVNGYAWELKFVKKPAGWEVVKLKTDTYE
ncbi:MAG: hypothetical protein ACOYOB_19385 [Myxococcota bacterium]